MRNVRYEPRGNARHIPRAISYMKSYGMGQQLLLLHPGRRPAKTHDENVLPVVDNQNDFVFWEMAFGGMFGFYSSRIIIIIIIIMTTGGPMTRNESF